MFFSYFFLFSAFSRLFSALPPLSWILLAVSPLKGLVDQHNIVPEFLYTIPWNIIILSPAKQPEKAAGTENNDRFYRSLRQADLQIAHISQFASIAKIDDLFTPQLAKSHKHISHLISSLCCLLAVPFRRFSTLFAAWNN